MLCLGTYGFGACQRARRIRRETTIVAAEPFHFELPTPPSASAVASAAAQAELRSTRSQGDANVLLARIFKPTQVTALGINLCADSEDPNVTVISSLVPESIAELSGAPQRGPAPLIL